MQKSSSKLDSQKDLRLAHKHIKSMRKQFKSFLQKNKNMGHPIGLPKIFKDCEENSDLLHNLSKNRMSTFRRLDENKHLSSLSPNEKQHAQQIKNKSKLKKKKMIINIDFNEKEEERVQSSVKKESPKSEFFKVSQENQKKVKKQLSKSIQNIGIVKRKKGTERIRGERNDRILNTLRNIEEEEKKYENRLKSLQNYRTIEQKNQFAKSQKSLNSSSDKIQEMLRYFKKYTEVDTVSRDEQEFEFKLKKYLQDNSCKNHPLLNDTNDKVLGLQKNLIETKNRLSTKRIMYVDVPTQQQPSNKLQHISIKSIARGRHTELAEIDRSHSPLKQPKRKRSKLMDREYRHSIDFGSYLLVMDREKNIEVKQMKINANSKKLCSKSIKYIKEQIGKERRQTEKGDDRERYKMETKYTPWNYGEHKQPQQLYELVNGDEDEEQNGCYG